jgi:hypothetical protein
MLKKNTTTVIVLQYRLSCSKTLPGVLLHFRKQSASLHHNDAPSPRGKKEMRAYLRGGINFIFFQEAAVVIPSVDPPLFASSVKSVGYRVWDANCNVGLVRSKTQKRECMGEWS